MRSLTLFANLFNFIEYPAAFREPQG